MRPLAERMRPQNLDDYVGQHKLLNQGHQFRKMIDSGKILSSIFWGPPGVGKTSLAKILASIVDAPFQSLSAIHSGVKDIRDAIDKAKRTKFFDKPSPILFVDEIHRFSKSQQDSLLGAVESGDITLIGATTENPSFEVIPALLSRCQVYVLEPLGKEELISLMEKALHNDYYLNKQSIRVEEYEAMLMYSGGDARKLYNILDLLTQEISEEGLVITNTLVEDAIQQNFVRYDKTGEMHYDIISAFIKSIRGSDPDAAIYYLARMLVGGEDPKFIARRLVISAAEDIGLANPNALLIANQCFDAVTKIGMPEGRIPLAEATIYLAASPKSNSAYTAINKAMSYVEQSGNLSIPLHLRNAPTQLMKTLNYSKNYHYAHDFENSFVKENYLPESAENEAFYFPKNEGNEAALKDRLKKLWQDDKKHY